MKVTVEIVLHQSGCFYDVNFFYSTKMPTARSELLRKELHLEDGGSGKLR